MEYNNHNNGYDEFVKLWVIKWQRVLSNLFRSRIVASFIMFYFPIKISGYILQYVYGYDIFSVGVFVSLLWIAIAPAIIENVLYHVINFFIKHKKVFRNEKEWKNIFFKEIHRIQSSRYSLYGVFWAIATSLIIVFIIFVDAPLLIQFWAGISFFILFFVSSIGFYGVYVLVTMMDYIFSADIIFDPFHADGFGGISDFGKFSVKISFYFSSGALAFPLAFEILANIGYMNSIEVFLVYLLLGLFVLTLFVSFLFPIFRIKSFVDPLKESIIMESRNKLNDMIKDFSESEYLDLKKGMEIYMHYHLVYLKKLEMKDYPWDIRVLLEFSLSFLIPIIVATLQLIF